MQNNNIIITIVILLLSFSTVTAQVPDCACGAYATRTGERDGSVYEIKCNNGHYSWVNPDKEEKSGGAIYQRRSNQNSSSNQNSPWDQINEVIDKNYDRVQQERLELAKMTPEQREWYLKQKNTKKPFEPWLFKQSKKVQITFWTIWCSFLIWAISV